MTFLSTPTLPHQNSLFDDLEFPALFGGSIQTLGRINSYGEWFEAPTSYPDSGLASQLGGDFRDHSLIWSPQHFALSTP